MKDRVKELRKQRGEAGFTLVELLIVLAILAILVAVVLPNFTGLLGKSQDTAKAAELNVVQTAVDARMAAEGLPTYDNQVTSSCDTSAMGLYPDYLRGDTTAYQYSIDDQGRVTQGAKCAGATPSP